MCYNSCSLTSFSYVSWYISGPSEHSQTLSSYILFNILVEVPRFLNLPFIPCWSTGNYYKMMLKSSRISPVSAIVKQVKNWVKDSKISLSLVLYDLNKVLEKQIHIYCETLSFVSHFEAYIWGCQGLGGFSAKNITGLSPSRAGCFLKSYVFKNSVSSSIVWNFCLFCPLLFAGLSSTNPSSWKQTEKRFTAGTSACREYSPTLLSSVINCQPCQLSCSNASTSQRGRQEEPIYMCNSIDLWPVFCWGKIPCHAHKFGKSLVEWGKKSYEILWMLRFFYTLFLSSASLHRINLPV